MFITAFYWHHYWILIGRFLAFLFFYVEFVPSEIVPRAHTRSRGPRVRDLISHIYQIYIYHKYLCLYALIFEFIFQQLQKKIAKSRSKRLVPIFSRFTPPPQGILYSPLSETLAHNVQDPEFFSTSCITRLLRLEFQMFRDFLHYITKEKIKFREGEKMQTFVKQCKIFQAFSEHFFLNVDNKCQ